MARTTIDSVADLKIYKKIGHGKTAEVFLVKDVMNNSYALKKFRNEYTSQQQLTFKDSSSPRENSYHSTSCFSDPENEVKVLSELGNHPNITRIHFFDGQHILMDLNRNGELFDYISLGSPLFDEELARFYFRQMVDVIDFMQQSSYAHRDIKPENILLDEHFNLKLSDFGFSTKQQEGEQLTHILGTDGYMAPELLRGRGYDGFKVDIFAMGVVLFCMVNGFPPYYKKAIATDPYYRFFVEKRTHVYWSCLQRKYNKNYSNEFMSLVTGMLAYNPQERIDLQMIKSHPWYQKPCSLTTEEIISRMTQIRSQINTEANV
ncbi:kinase domain protein (macronuclear) [Tetrahymena thermophila SB210]|uniref:non-specific serine/threonine protein kinase n=1 Tax=Tetrahymena thermophila (strain SB210) TaxID=312017 RepID=I7MCU4_TETTS|nr:kinase domain protein [Tetrahymena thermophila SB210]EAR84943.1 kinase domain protein [Tetrahymena thermophila SB210]|eukprot:XP_001032606.1 kinase domain protein [Tetrahymena thermophila SB210]